MDIIVHNVPSTITGKQLKASFVVPLREYGIYDFHCQLPRAKDFAFITVLDPSAGQRFLSFYGVPQNAPRSLQSKLNVLCNGQRLRCQMSRNKPTEFNIKALQFEASKRAAEAAVTVPQHNDRHRTRKFNLSKLRCGRWDYNEKSELVFVSEFELAKPGTIVFGQREAILLLGDIGSDQIRMDVTYYSCDNVMLGDYHLATITFTLHYSPKFYAVKGEDVLEAGMRALGISIYAGRPTNIGKTRILGINDAHRKVSGPCRVYQIRLTESSSLPKVRGLLQSTAKMPTHMSLSTPLQYPRTSFEQAYGRLDTQLTDTAFYGKMPFQIRYQMDRIARNGFLSPMRAIDLLPAVQKLWREHGTGPVAHALQKLTRRLPSYGPQTHKQYALDSLEADVLDLTESYDHDAPDNPYEIVKRHQHINLVHRVIITPTGIFLEGPSPEPTNRVLRQYAGHTDHFLRLVFCDEDGGSVRYDPRASQRAVYDERFRTLLLHPIIIAGMGFDFFGFSHSALRAHSCWSMAPIPDKGSFTLIIASIVLRGLGDFEKIRTPAKCAARIGQNFTDTNDTIDLLPSSVGELPVITRNGYDFSDGVGTISKDLLVKVWRVYGTRRLLKPTALQIRFQGAKGMVSLDSRLRGERLFLRSNMKKFETENIWKLEICGAAFKPLPMFFNRQLIKILEDRGVPSQVFFDLQEAAMAKLRYMTEHPVNAGVFLRDSIPRASQMSSLIGHLGEAGFDYHDDKFLYNVVELAVVTEVRDIKYRGRIPVKDGMTLYGIMDETGYLQEGEVFVITEQKATPSNGVDSPVQGGKQVLIQNHVVITRSPAMHPGDVQVVRAVNVPQGSPLQQLRNVVVFSQHGRRDLPSQLSGGDLDGDIFNIIQDTRLLPVQTWPAAEYPRVQAEPLDRPVTAADMSNFFVTFMETDQLGMISNAHMQLADQRPLGTLDPDCMKIAGMASTAVDFSKTGIAVNMKDLPRYDRQRPDFMAPNPRIQVDKSGELEVEDPDDFDDDAFEGIDEEKKPVRYYRSEKVLGYLYRNIDEKRFIADMQQHHHANARYLGLPKGLMTKLCDYVLHHANMYGILYEDYLDLARDIRAG